MGKVIEQCPECGEELEVVDAAPCDDCGWDPVEVEHFQAKNHTYGVFEVYGSKLTLCNFCEADFSSYDPEYWGLPKRGLVGEGSAGFCKIEQLAFEGLSIGKTKYCPSCRSTLKMVLAARKARDAKRT